MILRAVNQERARDAARVELAALEAPSSTSSTEPGNQVASPFAGNDALVKTAQLALGGLSALAAKHWGGHWILSEDESLALAQPVVDVVELETGDTRDPWTRLLIAFGMIAGPRAFMSFMGAGAPAVAHVSPAIAPKEESDARTE